MFHEPADLVNLLGTDFVAHGIPSPLDRVPPASQVFPGFATSGHVNHGIVCAMSLQNGCVGLARVSIVLKKFSIDKIGGEGDDPGQRSGMLQANMEGHGAPLRESCQDGSFGRNVLVVQKGADGPGRTSYSFGVVPLSRLEIPDVVPGSHHHSTVDGDWNGGRMGEYEPNAPFTWEVKHGDDRSEVVAIGAQSVEPDDRKFRRIRCFCSNVFQWCFMHEYTQYSKALFFDKSA